MTRSNENVCVCSLPFEPSQGVGPRMGVVDFRLAVSSSWSWPKRVLGGLGRALHRSSTWGQYFFQSIDEDSKRRLALSWQCVQKRASFSRRRSLDCDELVVVLVGVKYVLGDESVDNVIDGDLTLDDAHAIGSEPCQLLIVHVEGAVRLNLVLVEKKKDEKKKRMEKKKLEV